MLVKIFAAADLHLGMKFSAYPEVQAELSEARFKTLNMLVDLANKNECDLFIVAGDLFDRLSVSKKDIICAAHLLNSFQGKMAAVLPGNHDYYSGSDSTLWKTFREEAGDLVKIIDKKDVYPLNHYDLDINLYAGPCDSKHSAMNTVSWIKEIDKDTNVFLHIGIAHGSIEGFSPDADQHYFPMNTPELEGMGLDAWIIGHTHAQFPVVKTELNTLFIPGTPEPDGFDCRHPGTAWVIEFNERKKITYESVVTGCLRFEEEKIEIHSLKDIEPVIKRYSASEYTNTLLRLYFTGRLPREEYGELPAVRDALKGRLFYLHIDDSGVLEEITPEVIEEEFTKGSFPYLLLKRLIEEKDREALQTAYHLINEVRP